MIADFFTKNALSFNHFFRSKGTNNCELINKNNGMKKRVNQSV